MKFPYIETLSIFVRYNIEEKSMRYFETRFLDEADEFVAKLDQKAARKIIYNIDLAEQTNDPRLFKKLQNDIW